MKYVAMKKDELGFENRCFLFENEIYEFPAFDSDNDAMFIAFHAWKDAIEERLNKEWQEKYGSESYIFLERLYSDMSLSDWRKLGYGGLW